MKDYEMSPCISNWELWNMLSNVSTCNTDLVEQSEQKYLMFLKGTTEDGVNGMGQLVM